MNQSDDRHASKPVGTNPALDRIVDAINTIPEGYAFYDSDDRLVLANETYRKMLAAGA